MTERLYLHADRINRARMLDQIAENVLKEGGQIIKGRYWKETEMHGLFNISELSSRLESTTKVLKDIEEGKKERSEKAVNALKIIQKKTAEELETARAKQEETLYINKYCSVSWCSLSLTFTLNETYYYISLNDNPLFPVNYIKARIIKGQYKNSYMEELEHAPLYDEMFRYNCTAEGISAAAAAWYAELKASNYSKVYQESRRQRVANTYNNGYHYETIYSPVIMRNIAE